MRRALFPRNRYPKGHPTIAVSLNNLGSLHQQQQEHVQARECHAEALSMQRRLYPASEFPDGHRSIAVSLSNLADAIGNMGDIASAEELLQQAVAMSRQLSRGSGSSARGQGETARYLENLSLMLVQQEKFAEAQNAVRESLEIRRRLYPVTEYPNGHPDLLRSVANLAYAEREGGDYKQARVHLRQALQMCNSLYPRAAFPRGHPDLAENLLAIGTLEAFEGNRAAAVPELRRAQEMLLDLADAFCAAASEAEALAFTEKLSLTEFYVLSLSPVPNDSADDLYSLVWRRRGIVARALASRHRALGRDAPPEAAARFNVYQNVQRELARLAFAPADGSASETSARRSRLRHLSEEKEALERELAAKMPRVLDPQQHVRRPHTALSERLPIGAVLVDLVRSGYYDDDGSHYAAFIVSHSRQTTFVQIGQSAAVDSAVDQWRESIARNRLSQAPALLRRAVWEPIERAFPARTTAVYLVPDGPLTSLPWAALPGSEPGTILLERYALAVVPHGPFLLDQLTSPKQWGQGREGVLLAVGDVAFDESGRSMMPPPPREASCAVGRSTRAFARSS